MYEEYGRNLCDLCVLPFAHFAVNVFSIKDAWFFVKHEQNRIAVIMVTINQTRQEIVKFTDGEIIDVITYPLRKYHDDRGWLAELFRHDELAEEFFPAMSYISFTKPGVQRGPHEHIDQADLFCFIGPSTFNLRLWDNRPASPTYNNMMSLNVGEGNPYAVVVPKGVVHAYKNIGNVDGMVINCPNRLYMGEGKRQPIDEIRHEDDPDTPFRMND